MSDESVNTEIKRLEDLLTHNEEVRFHKTQLININTLIGNPMTEKMEEYLEYNKATTRHIKQKIRFFGQFKNMAMDANMLPMLQETMDEWLSSSWKYFGMENHETDAKTAMDEYQFFKHVCERVPKKPKKKTRRGGKKKGETPSPG